MLFMMPMSEIDQDVRRRVKTAVENWKEKRESSLDLTLDIQYDDSWAYWSGRPYVGVMECSESGKSIEFSFMPYNASKDDGYLKEILDEALESIRYQEDI